MQGNEIIVSPGINGPRGLLENGIVSGTPKPGTCMEMKAATANVDGRFTWLVAGTVQVFDGQPMPVVVLLPDSSRGKLATDAYVDGEICFLYWPVVGDRLNMRIANPSGDIAIGDKFEIDDGTGVLNRIATQVADYTTGNLDTEAEIIAAVNLNRRRAVFEALEAMTDPGAEALLYCRCIANC